MKSRLRVLILVSVAAFVILGCEFLGRGIGPVQPSAVSKQDGTSVKAGFEPADCSATGLTFENITTGNNDFEPYDGPHLICNSVATGSHGLNEIHHVNINKYQLESINTAFEVQKAVYITIVDDAVAWKEKNPTAGTDVVMIRDDEGGYVYLILTNASVQGCLVGEGYGVEKIDQYLVNLNFSSCEGDVAYYRATIETLRVTARLAVERVENRQ